MVFLQVFALLLLAWCFGAVQLSQRARVLHSAPMWLAVVWALGIVVCIGLGASGLLRYGDWESLSTGQALHRVFGEGNLAMRRSEWAALNRAAGVYLNLDVVWTLLALCVTHFHSAMFWSGVAERRRHARALRQRAR
ncbi:hypothetical protein LU699_11560 [Luteimonas fraxinea]|uniref:Uncharacterized protein n=1 Tax=Luteimonas fraxinea TaxID=2901869 RepID=A0ABS8UH98_9GAMM|nr:hypothetical protein [Luteimonas fraxinea]MCD9098664.1 hypothetical protein [Luteimonas fraxinea]UHH08937.1 hypothetical protein LU699_11560 [Luteimonas fraxinea]